jgi:hypothetical protein
MTLAKPKSQGLGRGDVFLNMVTPREEVPDEEELTIEEFED